MVLQRKLDFGFNGYQVPEVPRASRSARGRRSIWQKHEGHQIHAFEILANVAGELLQESSDHSLVSSVSCEKYEHNIVEDILKTNRNNNNKQSNEDSCKGGSFDKKKTICNEIQSQGLDCEKHSLNGSILHAKDNISFQTNSTTKDSNHSGMKSITSDSRNVCGDSLFFPEVIQENVNVVLERKLEAELTNIGNTNIKDKNAHVTSCSDDLMKLDKKSPNLVCSVHDVPESLSEVVSRDNDEKSPGSVQSSTRTITFKPHPDIENSNVKTPSAAKHWEVSTHVKYESYSKIAGEVKDPNQNGKDCYVDEKSQRIYPFKKRKFFNYEGIYDSPAKRMINGKNCNSAIGASSLKTGLQVTKSKDCNVKLSIKSFRVPELFIEIPTTATIGLLKRTVMDAVTAVLGDGLHVGILCQGKKVRDDDKTLLQTGISQDVKHNSFSFVLEPKHVNSVPSSCTSNPSFPALSTSQVLNRHSTSLMLRRGTSSVSKRPPRKELDCSVGDDIGLIPTPIDISNAKPNSQALVAVPAVGMPPLAVVSYHRKSRHPEYVQRRIRRPFSVSEVEALVQAVEKIGTGRWRDVKLRAFDTAKHRTYVDLKDKWKTLVHTARISPQQRRGEPVPQELLDRVLAAQAHWSHRQSKQQARSAA